MRSSIIWLMWIFFCRPLMAFETAWHYQATEDAAMAFDFSRHSADVLHIGVWGPDYYQVFQVLIGEQLEEMRKGNRLTLIAGIRRYIVDMANRDFRQQIAREQSKLMHFDNIDGLLNTNEQFLVLFDILYKNTVRLINETYRDTAVDESTRQTIILFAVGSSLHMVQDFYSHSNWVDIDFGRYRQWRWDLAERLPTFFQAYDLLAGKGEGGSKEKGVSHLPFSVASGIYDLDDLSGDVPMVSPGIPMTHTLLCHDNSQLHIDGVSSASYHSGGLIPASTTVVEHQQLAVRTAISASKEWLARLMEDKTVARAIDFSRKMKKRKLLLTSNAEVLVDGMLRSSCLVDKFDGEHPLEEQQKICQRLRLSATTVYVNMLRGNWELLPSPSNPFWQIYIDANIIGRLAPEYPQRTVILGGF